MYFSSPFSGSWVEPASEGHSHLALTCGVDTDQGTFDMDQGIWAGLNPFEHSMHPALGLSLSSSTIHVLCSIIEVHEGPSFDIRTRQINVYFRWIERETSLL